MRIDRIKVLRKFFLLSHWEQDCFASLPDHGQVSWLIGFFRQYYILTAHDSEKRNYYMLLSLHLTQQVTRLAPGHTGIEWFNQCPCALIGLVFVRSMLGEIWASNPWFESYFSLQPLFTCIFMVVTFENTPSYSAGTALHALRIWQWFTQISELITGAMQQFV